MGLGIYSEISPSNYRAHSTSGAQTEPVVSIHDGKRGTVIEKKLFVRATDAHTYSNIQVEAKSLTVDADIGSGVNPGSTGWGVKLIAKDNPPTVAEWSLVDYGDPVDIANVTDNNTYRPFWFRVESPAAESIRNKTNIALFLLYTEVP